MLDDIKQRTTVQHVKWPKIHGFSRVYRDHRSLLPKITYRPTVKLHGTNSSVVFDSEGNFYCQSRNRLLIGEGNDNHGFAEWFHSDVGAQEFFKHRAKVILRSTNWRPLNGKHKYVVFGEWCGAGINPQMGIGQIDKAIFAIFAEVLCDLSEGKVATTLLPPSLTQEDLHTLDHVFVIEPPSVSWMKKYLKPLMIDDNLIEIDISSVDNHTMMVLDEATKAVCDVDPWVKETFGVEGPGEGIVFHPIRYHDLGGLKKEINFRSFGSLAFKAKGEKYRTTKSRKAVSLTPEEMSSIQEFIESTLTEARLGQAYEEVIGSGPPSIEHIGPFLSWVCKDIHTEARDEIEQNDIDWKKASRAASTKARQWLLRRINELP